MQRKSSKIQVDQSIQYCVTHEEDHWKLNTQADFISLNSFDKLTYSDLEKHEQVVKLFKQEPLIVEIKRDQNVMRFEKGQSTYSNYQTPQGLWELRIDTQKLDWDMNENQAELVIEYQLVLQEEIVGNYRFQLIYER